MQRRSQERGSRGRIKLTGVGVVRRMFEFAVSAQVVRARVRGAAQRAFEATGEVHVVVVANVGHHLAAQFTAVEVQRTSHSLECQPHVPTLGACNTHTSLPTHILHHINTSPGDISYTTHHTLIGTPHLGTPEPNHITLHCAYSLGSHRPVRRSLIALERVHSSSRQTARKNLHRRSQRSERLNRENFRSVHTFEPSFRVTKVEVYL